MKGQRWIDQDKNRDDIAALAQIDAIFRRHNDKLAHAQIWQLQRCACRGPEVSSEQTPPLDLLLERNLVGRSSSP